MTISTVDCAFCVNACAWEHVFYFYMPIFVRNFSRLVQFLSRRKKKRVKYDICDIIYSLLVYPICSLHFGLNFGWKFYYGPPICEEGSVKIFVARRFRPAPLLLVYWKNGRDKPTT